MSDEIYHKLARVLDTLPNGFPSTDSGVEIRILKKIFTPEDAELFCRLRLTFETVEQIAQRTGLPLKGLEEQLIQMAEKGQLFMIELGGTRIFKMLPWVFGIYEFQLGHLDKEFVELHEEYRPVFGKQFYTQTPQMMQTLPVEEEIKTQQIALPFERVSTLIESSQSFRVLDCICKKEQAILNNPCQKPKQVCMAFAPVPDIFHDDANGRAITKEEAKSILKQAEEVGLVHLTSNFQNGRFFICNCCGCCCGVLHSINKLGLPASQVINSHYYARIDEDACTACGICADERCQVHAIEAGEDTYRVIQENCIGCGLCATTCPAEAIELIRKEEKDSVLPPMDEAIWFKERGKQRGIDFSKYE